LSLGLADLFLGGLNPRWRHLLLIKEGIHPIIARHRLIGHNNLVVVGEILLNRWTLLNRVNISMDDLRLGVIPSCQLFLEPPDFLLNSVIPSNWVDDIVLRLPG
jgi:hypothetical protein